MRPSPGKTDRESDIFARGRSRRSRQGAAEVSSAEFIPLPARCRQHPGVHGMPAFVTSACIGTINALTAWSPGFSRSKHFEPPEGGTPNQPRCMESAAASAGAPHRVFGDAAEHGTQGACVWGFHRLWAFERAAAGASDTAAVRRQCEALRATIAPDKNAGVCRSHWYPWTARLRPCREDW